MKYRRLFAVVLLSISISISFFTASVPLVRADTYNQIPLWINIMKGATISRDQIDNIEKEMDAIFAKAGLNWRVTSVVIKENYTDPNTDRDQPGDVRIGPEEDGLYKDGEKEVKGKAGVKITVVRRILNSTGGRSGFVGGAEIVPGTRTIVVASNFSTGAPVGGQVWGHELGHVLGLGHKNPDNSSRPDDDLMNPVALGGTNLTAADVATMNRTKIERALGLPSLTNDQMGRTYDMYHYEGEDFRGDSWYPFTDIFDGYFSFYILDETRDLYISTLLGGLIPEGMGFSNHVALDCDNDPATGGEFDGWLGIDYVMVTQGLGSEATTMLYKYPEMLPMGPLETEIKTFFNHRCSEDPESVIQETPLQHNVVIKLPLMLLPLADSMGVAMSIQSADGLGTDRLELMVVNTSPPVRPILTLSPPVAPSGTLVSASGSGFQPSANISIIFAHYNLSTTTVDPAGMFYTTFTVPEFSPDHFMVDAIDTTFNVGVAMFTVVASLPEIALLSPENRNYYASSVELVFYVNESVSWMAYSLNGLPNVTISGNISISGLSYGDHQVKVYIGDEYGYSRASSTAYFRTTIPGDVDGDFDVDILDVVKITGIYALREGDPGFNRDSDIDGDGVITIFDVVLCTGHYGQEWP